MQPVALIVGIGDQALVLLDKRWNTNVSRISFLKEAMPRNQIATWIERVCVSGINSKNN
jgi:hypothetical protein